uniref:Mitochondrial fission process protein 1 n=1 Tax=Lotharella globosa TaxID=91324 RepID=A0A6V3UCH0_9EUKA
MFRYVAYSSDIGESMRPIVHPRVVTALYGVTWAYVFGDVAHAGYIESTSGGSNTEIARTMIFTLTFQSIASVLIPSVIIHQAVHFSQHGLENMKAPAAVRRYGAAVVGLALIPGMPYIDEPIEHLIEQGFDYVWPSEKAKKH